MNVINLISLNRDLFRVFIEHHYGSDGFFGEAIRLKYLLHLPSLNEVKCRGEIYK